jgi:ribose transport system permease protein
MAEMQPDARHSHLGRVSTWWRSLITDYGMALVLFGMITTLTGLTWKRQPPGLESAAEQLLAVAQRTDRPIWLVGSTSEEDRRLIDRLRGAIPASRVTKMVLGGPPDFRRAAQERPAGAPTPLLLCSSQAGGWSIVSELAERLPGWEGVEVAVPNEVSGSSFLKRENLINVANQITVIAMVAIGMTLVILTGGIDLSVGSLIALSAVVACQGIAKFAGGVDATWLAVVGWSGLAILLCALHGWLNGVWVTFLRVPPFIATLATMLIASGHAFMLSKGQSIDQLPTSFRMLGQGRWIGVPVAVWLMIGFYLSFHWILGKTTFGRALYAVGGNSEAARMSGIGVRRVVLIAYTLCGAMAGLGGVLLSSQLQSGAATYGAMYELLVIAAVVVGGASLSGGRGKILGTLIGALVIAVIQNGMNLLGVDPFLQKVVLGYVILGAVLLDRWRSR